MSNELNNIIARNSDGVYEGVAIGGDRYPGTRFIDHLLRYQDNPAISVRRESLTTVVCKQQGRGLQLFVQPRIL